MRSSRRRLVVALAAVAACSTLGTALATVGTRSGMPLRADPGRATPGAERLARLQPETVVSGVATFAGDGAPAVAALDGLRAAGVQYQAMGHLPLALVRGTVASLVTAVRSGAAVDVYPNERLEYLSGSSTRAITANVTRAAGLTGRGVTVAVVDSGIDATHPDLADHVAHNVKLVSPEYVNQDPKAGPGTIVLPVDQGPYNNSDLGSGHGTHVAGIIAADGHTGPDHIGVAPDATLVGYAIGEVLFTTAVITAFDHILDNPKWGIRVINNSWGSRYSMFDPGHPINIATKAVSRKGIVIAFAAGNDGDEMSTNPFAAAPWVISVGSGTVTRQRSSFSSRGLEFDNSIAPTTFPKDGHVRVDGDGVGLYEPDVSTPGSDIESSGTPTGAAVRQDPGGDTATASGTSMATPHVAGAAAVLLQANPALSADHVRQALQATAAPMADGSKHWESGYGFVDLASAAALVKTGAYAKKIAAAQAAADARVRAARSWYVRIGDYWMWQAPVATMGGVPDHRSFTLAVPGETTGLKISIGFPSAATFAGNPYASYSFVVKDAVGRAVARSGAPSGDSGLATAFVDRRKVGSAPGRWSIDVTGDLDLSDPDTLDNEALLGRYVNLAAVQLKDQVPAARPRGRTFVPGAQSALFFGADGAGPVSSPEGCPMETGTPAGSLVKARSKLCEAGSMGYAANETPGAGTPAQFLSGPLSNAAVIGGDGFVVLHLVDALQPVWSNVSEPRVNLVLDAVDAKGAVVVPVLATELGLPAAASPEGARGVYPFKVPPVEVPAGTRLRLGLKVTGVATSTMRLLYGGAHDSALVITTGTFR